MSKVSTSLIAGVLVALILGTVIGYMVYPSMNPVIAKSEYDAKVTELNKAKADLTKAQAQITNLTKQKKVGLVLATGGLGDKSFNDISYVGAKKAEAELGIKLDFVQPKAIAEYEGYQRDFAKTGDYILIIGIGFDQAEGLTKVAAEYPNQKFAIVDMVVGKPNVLSLLFNENEGSFLVGVVAGMLSKTGKLGFVGGLDIPLIRNFYVGYKAGAQWANSSVTVLDTVFVGDWSDPTKAKELALSLISSGVDGIYPAAGKSGLGALAACNETGINAFGYDSCMCYLYPEIKVSMTKRVDVAVYETIVSVLLGTFKGGLKSGGIVSKWVGCCRLVSELAFWERSFNFTHSALPSNITSKLTEAVMKISFGDIIVPSGYG